MQEPPVGAQLLANENPLPSLPVFTWVVSSMMYSPETLFARRSPSEDPQRSVANGATSKLYCIPDQ